MLNFFAAGLGVQPESRMAMVFAITTEVYTPPLLVRRANAAFSAIRRRDEALGMTQLLRMEAGKRGLDDGLEGLAASTNNKRACL
mgnify:CR=1 FL=1